jgi:hypothetical protein
MRRKTFEGAPWAQPSAGAEPCKDAPEELQQLWGVLGEFGTQNFPFGYSMHADMQNKLPRKRTAGATI